ncbi:MAG TPA: adenylate/guanylate cyclase domain-containing protein, partial [Egibacteraceae bacterium]|nr:adenylate/guanylate cyclase domain-containing protein [Egibacteraceae bacterium]
MWRGLLLGEDSTLKRLRTVFNRLPGTPRCKVCAAPFRGPARMVTRIAMHGRSPENPLMCGVCMWSLRRRPGGAEVPGSVLFADVRGSTGLAEGRTAAQYHRLLQRFYALAATAIERHRGILDKFLGDGVMALYIPLTSGDAHARAAVGTARDLLAALRRADGDLAALGVGCGVHTGDMFVGALGTDDRVDFSALGDTVNIAARLGSIAG